MNSPSLPPAATWSPLRLWLFFWGFCMIAALPLFLFVAFTVLTDPHIHQRPLVLGLWALVLFVVFPQGIMIWGSVPAHIRRSLTGLLCMGMGFAGWNWAWRSSHEDFLPVIVVIGLIIYGLRLIGTCAPADRDAAGASPAPGAGPSPRPQ
jgi:hypothetical protein